MSPPSKSARRAQQDHTADDLARAGLSPFCLGQDASVFDQATAGVVHLGYMAVSALMRDPLPFSLFSTFLADQRRAFDGVFVLRSEQVDAIVANSESLSQRVALEKKLLVRAFTAALLPWARAAGGDERAVARWAASIVGRLRQQSASRGGFAREDITTVDLIEASDGSHPGAWVQLSPGDDFATFISFGAIGLHFEGTAQLSMSSASIVVQLDLHAVLSDTFDFHFVQEDPGTGWADHALARLQCSGYAKPFRIEGQGTPFRLMIAGWNAQ